MSEEVRACNLSNRDIDILVAGNVMQHRIVIHDGNVHAVEGSQDLPPYLVRGKWANIPYYSSEIEEAWPVIVKMKERGYVLHIGNDFLPPPEDSVKFQDTPVYYVSFTINEPNNRMKGQAWGESIARVICEAALDALRVPWSEGKL